jgi:DNA-binding NtrC family response regulator
MKPIVFYIDDSEDALELAHVIVKDDERFQLVLLQNTDELTNALKGTKPAAALIDLNLGNDLTGTIVAIKLRAEYPDLPIAIYTAYEKNRVQKLLANLQSKLGKMEIWQKIDIGVDNLADSIVRLIHS